jgi:hypothetical protein
MFKMILSAFAFAVLALPAMAGDVNVSNGKGMWQSTMCQRPIPPAFVGMGRNAPAATLNAATASYNLFVQQTQDYMKCLSNEAKADSEASHGLIMATVERQMQDAQTEADRTRLQLFGPAK